MGDLSRERRAQRRAFPARWPESGQESGVKGIPGKGLGRFSWTELAWDAISRDERASPAVADGSSGKRPLGALSRQTRAKLWHFPPFLSQESR